MELRICLQKQGEKVEVRLGSRVINKKAREFIFLKNHLKYVYFWGPTM